MRHTVPILNLESESPEKFGEDSVHSRPKDACLVKIYPPVVTGSLIALDRDEILFGRDISCDYELSDDFASRRHAVIRWVDRNCMIVDQKSMNGTYVNDQRVGEQVLKSGDQIRIGHHIFKFLASDHVEAMYHEAVFEMMTVDALTKTYNRRYFEDAFLREINRSFRHGRQLGLLLLDIDYFKQINDTHGHLIGDELLAGVCKRVNSRVRNDEIFARVGGEEFALVIVECTLENLRRLGDELCELVGSKPFTSSKGDINVTISIGVAHALGSAPITMNGMLEQADKNLYEAKRLGRNRCCS